jgi:DNA ligase-1
MEAFAELLRALDETTKTHRKVDALVAYFRSAPPRDAAWTISFLVGRKPRQVVPSRNLKAWAAELAGIPQWLFDASYDVVGDLAENHYTAVAPRRGIQLTAAARVGRRTPAAAAGNGPRRPAA